MKKKKKKGKSNDTVNKVVKIVDRGSSMNLSYPV